MALIIDTFTERVVVQEPSFRRVEAAAARFARRGYTFQNNPPTVPTASHAGPSSAGDPSSSVTPKVRGANPPLPSPTFQPPYPSPSPAPTAAEEPETRVTNPTRWSLRNAFIGGGNPEFPSPFRSRAGTGVSTVSNRPRRTSAARLWNPTNSTPRTFPQTPPRSQQRARTQRRDRSPVVDRAVIAIPLSHPAIGSPREEGSAPGEYPLLTLPEQRQTRHSGSFRASLQVERSGSSNESNRVSLPRSVSIDITRKKSGESSPLAEPKVDKGKGKAVGFEPVRPKTREGKPSGYRHRGQSVGQTVSVPGLSFDKRKAKANMSTDIERGPEPENPHPMSGILSMPHSTSNTSLHTGVGAALSSEGTSVVGSDGPAPNPGEEWGPQHPCFPHMNPHVPLSSPLYQTTRIIRIRRDWMLEGDLAPTFSNLYPEILDPAGLSEQDFRTIVEKVNNELIPAFNPWAARNILDATLGLLTGWLWDDCGFTSVKSRLRKVEQYLEDWNREMESKCKDGLGAAPQIVSLRRTGYMNLDIQVSDPEVAYPVSTVADGGAEPGLSRQITRP